MSNLRNPKYVPSEIESKWQKIWDKKGVYSPDVKSAKKPYYNLMMFPYPSAEGLHVGNVYAFTGADVWGRYQRMQGYDVFEPIGLDGFGIHSENYAIKIDTHPVEQSKKAEVRFYRQLQSIGNGFAWDKRVETYNPNYYRWTQWLFIQMFKHGLAYRKKAAVNWCPSCLTVLADEQVLQKSKIKNQKSKIEEKVGVCERCESEVKQRELEQWFFRITDYADRLLSNLTEIDWADKVKIAQKQWIGKKEGIEITYDIDGSDQKVTVFTTRPDTNFGATFIVIAPEHTDVPGLTTPEHEDEVEKYVKSAKAKSAGDRMVEGRKKTGAFTGSYAINQLTGEKMSIWVADFVLAGFGTGAVVGVPGHDLRDFEFAKEFKLPIKRVVVGSDGDDSEITDEKQVQEAEGKMVNSDFLDGMDIHEATQKIMDYMEEKGWGKKVTTYHLRDWLISRQRYWGPPIPMIYCQSCASAAKGEAKGMPGWYSVPEDDLPIELPYVENFKPTGIHSTRSGASGQASSGQAVSSPLAQDKEWVKVDCPGCGGEARRETDVSDTFLDSAWYFLRYPSARSTRSGQVPFDPEITKKWLPVNMYIGGAEHSVLHLMYSRFVTMALKDWGYLDFEEPFTRFYAHGLIIKGGAKMSKSKGNVIVPDEYIKKFGADTLRMYLQFLGPFDQGGDFRDSGIEGMHRFVKRVYTLVTDHFDADFRPERAKDMATLTHKTIKRVTKDLEGLRYNRAISGVMEFVNSLTDMVGEWSEEKQGEFKKIDEWHEAVKTLLLLLAPFAPHVTEELYQNLRTSEPQNVGHAGNWSIHQQAWPTFDPLLVQDEVVTIAIQVNGKLRGTIEVSAIDGKDEKFVVEKAQHLQTVSDNIGESELKKVVFVPGRLVNFVL